MCHATLIEQPRISELLALRPFYPPRICLQCLAHFESIGPKYCPACGRQMPRTVICADCRRWQHQYPDAHFSNRALFTYNPAMQTYFQQYKGQGDYQLRLAFQWQIRQAFPLRKQTCYVPIPTDPQHLQQRGFNPVVGLFETCFPLTELLVNLPTDKSQAQKNRAERLATPQFFAFEQDRAPVVAPKHFILVDDIYTTGRTLWHAQRCLRKRYPNASIQAMTLVH